MNVKSNKAVAISRRVGLARALSKLGYCSRSRAVVRIRAGEVRLNGRVVCDPETPVRLEKDRITVAAEAVASADPIYLMLNKPRGVVTTAADEKGRKTVYDLLQKDLPWLASVGRLDKASEGIMLFTNDSEWAAKVLNPRTHLQKTYHVQIGALGDEALLTRLIEGVTEGGECLKVSGARILRQGRRNSWLEIVLEEGKNRHLRRMMKMCGVEVLRLMRVAIGPLVLADLKKSSYRQLTASEKRRMDEAMER